MKTKLFTILIILLWSLPLLAQEFDTAWVRRYYEETNRKDLSGDVAVQPKFKALREGEMELFKERRFEKDRFERYGHPSMPDETEPFHPAEPFNLTPQDLPVGWRLPVYQPAGGSGNIPAEMGLRAITDDFLVNDDTTGGNNYQTLPAVARGSSGNFIITWVDHRSGVSDIYAQRYNPSGTPIGSNFRVNEVSMFGEYVYKESAVAMDGSGSFIITWSDARNYDSDIYAQRYDSAGTPLGGNFMVNDHFGYWQADPAVAADISGNFVITWTLCQNGLNVFDIYAQRYDSAGTPLGANFKVNDDGESARQQVPDIAMDGSGNFVITWTDNRNGGYNYDIYAQMYDSWGNLLGANFKVNDDTSTAGQIYSNIAVDDSGDFVITWLSRPDIYAQRYNFSGTPVDSNFKVNDDSIYAFGTSFPDVASDGSGNFVITWQREYPEYMYAQRYDSSGNPVGSNFMVADTIGGWTGESYPAIASDHPGNFVITWADYRHGSDNPDIYAQMYDSAGNPLGVNFRVCDDFGVGSQLFPSIAANDFGNFVITWIDLRNGNYKIYAQRYTSPGTPIDSNFRVINDEGSANWIGCAVAMDHYGNFVCTWGDFRNSTQNLDIYAQRYNAFGDPQGSNFRVNDDTIANYQSDPAVATSPAGDFVITWLDSRIPGGIYAQRYDSSGNPLGPNFMVNENTLARRFWPAVAMDVSGGFVIAWRDYRIITADIYAQRYDSTGTPLGGNFKVNDDPGTSEHSWPDVAMDDFGNFTIVWWDERNSYGNPDVYAQSYDPSGNPLGGNYLVTNPQNASFAQCYPSVAANNCNLYFAWQDNRRAKGWDIYANIKGYHPPDAFSLLFPPNKAFTPRKVRFGWETATDPNPSDSVRYDLYVSTSYHSFLDSATVDSNLVASEHTKTLDYGTYYWKVKAKDNYGAERWSSQIGYFMVTGIHYSGDINGDGFIDAGDVVFLINYLYNSGPAPDPLELGDINCDDKVNSADVVFLINYLFNNGPSPSC